MISRTLLTAKGSIDALTALQQNDTLTTKALSEKMDVAEGTARERLSELEDAGLVSEDADLRDGRPVRVFAATDDGTKLATSLASILDDVSTGNDAASEESEDTEAEA